MLLTLKTKLYYGYYLTKNQCIRLLAASTRVRSASTLFHKRSPLINRCHERLTNTNRSRQRLVILGMAISSP